MNEWIRTGGRFDAVIDLDAAFRDSADPERLRPEADTGATISTPTKRGTG